MAHGSIGGDDNMKRAAHGALLVLLDNLPKGCKVLIYVDEIVTEALKRHGEHLATHVIKQTHLDPVKLVCWLGCAIIERLENENFHQHERIIDALLDTLEQFLALETGCAIRLRKNDRELAKRLLMQEIQGNGDHGIGFNGLFFSFHCFRSAFEQMQAQAKN